MPEMKKGGLMDGSGSEWDESKHPRDEAGRFTDGSGGDSLEELREQERQEYAESQRLAKVKAEYEASVNPQLVDFAQRVLTGKQSVPFQLIDISAREISDIKEITGVDVTGFSRFITPDSIRHIEKRHGSSGIADRSMADVNDIARMEYVLANYDSINFTGKLDYQYPNSDGTPAKQIAYQKRINGSYYIAETVPDAKAKRLIIKSAYKKKPSS